VRTRKLTIPIVLAAGLIAGCGADDENKPSIPPDSAAALEEQLDSIQSRFNVPGGQACGDITGGDDPNTSVVRNVITSLPDSVDADVRDALVQSFDRLFELVQQECADLQQTETTPETDTTETTETTETTTETTPTTETEPPTTDTTETEPTDTNTIPTETLPPEDEGEGGDDGGGGFGPGS
jgi:hypothetical protein